ncbi:L-piperidine-6-carboxylate dehydrogenase [Sphingorhabdus wooponensis]|jgi:aldehyde dehydrogenase (NAD+)|uniref:aldehyde dehydrogenase (NAD(+)) n=1 Tax=Sphingorhabdus wooponensis TaxID=940136 RepID=A0A3R8Q6W8_9SPHN|nr:aldehyde dehydrogenase family protein [Sphingorhabdus wooponensis]RRQ51006.1 aldehyde dehydrogenase family protein [Sphingorhabdus wooponensis]
MTRAAETKRLLETLGCVVDGGDLAVHSPIDGSRIGAVATATMDEIDDVLAQSRAAFLSWRNVPAPRRGELVRLFGNALRAQKNELARLVTLDCGKPLSEGLGEVQEMIDICDFAVGLSRQLHGLTIASERPGHRMMEQWHPLGPVLVISAFNFPVAVWAWNAALALVCGNSVIWKPSEKTPLTAAGVQAIFEKAVANFGNAPAHLSQVVQGGPDIGAALVADPRVALISATGSTEMGRKVGQVAAARFAKTILELGGNNAAIISDKADLGLALRGVLFSAFGTSGQRCTSLRRLFVHDAIYDSFVGALKSASGSMAVGDPLDSNNLAGPLIDEHAFAGMQAALDEARALGGYISGGERIAMQGVYVRPALVEMMAHDGPALRETFAPILYIFRYHDLAHAIALQNSVGAGLSSSLFSTDMRECEQFLSAEGSDCGIANVNIGTSGAEIGGAFGGEKETGGGRESGSDAWKAYMRRTTNTINYSDNLPLAQGVTFDIG